MPSASPSEEAKTSEDVDRPAESTKKQDSADSKEVTPQKATQEAKTSEDVDRPAESTKNQETSKAADLQDSADSKKVTPQKATQEAKTSEDVDRLAESMKNQDSTTSKEETQQRATGEEEADDASAEADRAEAEECGNILQASFEGKLGAVRHFLKDPNAVKTTHEGWTSLHCAANKGHDSVVQRLLAAGAAVEAAATNGFTSLLLAAENGHDAVVQRLLAAGAAVEAVENYGATSLHCAANKGHDSVVQRLLAAGAAVEAVENDGRTSLHCAAQNGHDAVVQRLLAAGAAVEAAATNGWTSLHLAAQNGQDSVVQRLLAAGAAVDAVENDGWTSLHYAAANGHDAVVRRLLAAGAAVEAAANDGWRPLHLAAESGHDVVVEVLLAAGATLDALSNQGLTPLHVAAFNGQDHVAQRLLTAIADTGGTPPDYAAFKGSVHEHVALAVDDKGQTQLHIEASYGFVAGVERLLAAGAAVDAVDNEGRTAYDVAKAGGHRKVMGLLDPVFVVLLSGRSCRCDSSDDRSVQDLKTEAEEKLGVKIQHLIGPNMEQLTESKSLVEANVEPGSTVFVVISPAADAAESKPTATADAAESKAISTAEETNQSQSNPQAVEPEPAEEGFDLQDPQAYIDFLIAANIRLVRLEFLKELHENALPMPRRQEAELLRTKDGATALVELKEYKQLRIDKITGRVSAPKSDMPTVHFVSISHMWEAREHPDPWGHQLSTMVNRCSNRKGITWLFIDYMSLYQFERKSTREEDCFRAALRDMHTLYSHEVVEVEILEDLTPSHVQSEQASRKIPIFSTSRNKVVLVCITELTLNPTPHRLRGWCQAEKQWSLLRTLLEFIPMPPEEFRKVMHNLKFTHRDDSDAVFLLQKKVFLAKTASTTHLQLERPSPEDLVLFRVALPHYKRLTHLVINGTHLTIEDAIAVVTSGAEDIQMESCHLASDAVHLAAKLTDKSAQHLKRLNLARNGIDEAGLKALEQVMRKRPELTISLAGQFDDDSQLQLPGMCEE